MTIDEVLPKIKGIVAECFWVEIDFLQNPSRKQPFPVARFGVFWCLREIGCTCAEIERRTNFTYRSITHGIDRFNDLLDCGDERCKAVRRKLLELRANQS